ncbi:GPW/gp25 family protein [Paraburkholderia bannensis]|uniref:GPW/gp25 family protein n=1 Tax=Paraburkholderia bannensis TaxID=765414 RepID=UPI00048A403C|nr:GPW/gp25 family protein [Paraburkholderia bannensis]
MKGMNAITGRTISGLDHLYQSIGQILSTALASRLKRRTFGSDIPDLIDAPTNNETRTRLYAATATALMRWEPRLTLTRVQFAMDTNDAGQPVQYLDIEGYTTEAGEPVNTSINLSTGAAS